MRRLVLLPLLIFAFACSDSLPVQPEDDTQATATLGQGHSDMAYEFALYWVGSFPPFGPEPEWDGDLESVYSVAGFEICGRDRPPSTPCEGEIHGFGYFAGESLNDWGDTRPPEPFTGSAFASGSVLVVLHAPEVGAFTCKFESPSENGYKDPLPGRWYGCRGSGGFQGVSMRVDTGPGLLPWSIHGTAMISKKGG
jgi:hypothetical protein